LNNNFKKIINRFAQTNVLVVGDAIVDVYHEGKTLGMSAETPTLVVQDTSTSISVGGACFLVRNMLTLGGNVTFITLVGDDSYAEHLDTLNHKNLQKVIMREKSRKTTVKERFWADDYKLLSWDHLDNRPISVSTEKKIINFIKRKLDFFDKLVISDYRHGLLPQRLVNKLMQIAKERKRPVYVDSQISQRESNHLWYKGANTVCLNRREALSVDPEFNERRLRSSLARIKNILRASNIILKLGEGGSASLLGKIYIKTTPREVMVKDTTGAGDAFFAVIILAPKLGREELKIANTWAALSTTVVGTEPPTKESLIRALAK